VSSVEAALKVSPSAVELRSPEVFQQVLVSEPNADGRPIDLTRQVSYTVADPSVATITSDGLIQPHRDGQTEIVIKRDAQEVKLPVTVVGVTQPKPVSFEHQIAPLLTKASCNMGGCHGKAEGQNGFKLSVFGFDTVADFEALTKEGRGRRISLASPEQSLILLKGTAKVPHGGGRKLEEGNHRYELLKRWIEEGGNYVETDPATIVSLEVEPSEQVLAPGETQQIRVTVVDSNGQRRCVTAEAEYGSNADLIAVPDQRGLIQAGKNPGEAAILARYMGHVAICRITLPRQGVTFPRPAETNFVDKHVWDKLTRLGIIPSERADDAMFLRRVYLDMIGTLPTAVEARKFLSSTEPNKRSKLIDELLERPEYADFWAMRWADVLRTDRDKITPQATVATTRWLRKQITENRPYNEMVYDIITASGSTTSEGPASLYKSIPGAEAQARSISQLFLGVRIECAQCHHHPSEKWGQEDYYALAGFFTGVTTKASSTGGDVVYWKTGSDLNHPRTKQPVPTKALGAAALEFTPSQDRRVTLADWMTSPDNPFLAKAIVNRIWAHYFGRGLVMPIDDMRATNPAGNEPLLNSLADYLKEAKYDLRALTRTLLNSQAYQLSSATNESNLLDDQNFSHAAPKALPAEVMLDAIGQVTGMPEKFNGWPAGYRSIQVWDNRMLSYFFRIFGRPTRVSVCECERSNEPSIAQALHLMNSPEIMSKIHDVNGHVFKIAQTEASPEEIIEDLYLTALSRFPKPNEVELMKQAFAESPTNRRQAVEDVLWALVNSKEFLCSP